MSQGPKSPEAALNQINLLLSVQFGLANANHNVKLKAIKFFQDYIAKHKPEVYDDDAEFLYVGDPETTTAAANKKAPVKGLLYYAGMDSGKHGGQLKRICGPVVALIRWLVTLDYDAVEEDGEATDSTFYKCFVCLTVQDLSKANFIKHLSSEEEKKSMFSGTARSGNEKDSLELLSILMRDHRTPEYDEYDPLEISMLLGDSKLCKDKLTQYMQKNTAEQVAKAMTQHKQTVMAKATAKKVDNRPKKWSGFKPVPLQEGEEGDYSGNQDVLAEDPPIPDPLGLSELDLRATQALHASGRIKMTANVAPARRRGGSFDDDDDEHGGGGGAGIETYSVMPSDRNFSPSLFLTLVHGAITFSELNQGMENLRTRLHQQSSQRENLVRTHFGLFVHCAEGLEWLKAYRRGVYKTIEPVGGARRSSDGGFNRDGVTRNIAKAANMKPGDNGEIKLGRALESLAAAKREAQGTLAPIIDRMRRSKKIKSADKFLRRLTSTLEHPHKMRICIEKGDYEEAMAIYKRVQAIPNTSTIKVIHKVRESVDGVVSELSSKLLSLMLDTPEHDFKALERYGKILDELGGSYNGTTPSSAYRDLMKLCFLQQLGFFNAKLHDLILRFSGEVVQAFDHGWALAKARKNELSLIEAGETVGGSGAGSLLASLMQGNPNEQDGGANIPLVPAHEWMPHGFNDEQEKLLYRKKPAEKKKKATGGSFITGGAHLGGGKGGVGGDHFHMGTSGEGAGMMGGGGDGGWGEVEEDGEVELFLEGGEGGAGGMEGQWEDDDIDAEDDNEEGGEEERREKQYQRSQQQGERRDMINYCLLANKVRAMHIDRLIGVMDKWVPCLHSLAVEATSNSTSGSSLWKAGVTNKFIAAALANQEERVKAAYEKAKDDLADANNEYTAAAAAKASPGTAQAMALSNQAALSNTTIEALVSSAELERNVASDRLKACKKIFLEFEKARGGGSTSVGGGIGNMGGLGGGGSGLRGGGSTVPPLRILSIALSACSEAVRQAVIGYDLSNQKAFSALGSLDSPPVGGGGSGAGGGGVGGGEFEFPYVKEMEDVRESGILDTPSFAAELGEPYLSKAVHEVGDLYDVIADTLSLSLMPSAANQNHLHHNIKSDSAAAGGGNWDTGKTSGGVPFSDALLVLKELSVDGETTSASKYMDRLLLLCVSLFEHRHNKGGVNDSGGPSSPSHGGRRRKGGNGEGNSKGKNASGGLEGAVASVLKTRKYISGGDAGRGEQVVGTGGSVELVILSVEKLIGVALRKLAKKARRVHWIVGTVMEGLQKLFSALGDCLRKECILLQDPFLNGMGSESTLIGGGGSIVGLGRTSAVGSDGRKSRFARNSSRARGSALSGMGGGGGMRGGGGALNDLFKLESDLVVWAAGGGPATRNTAGPSGGGGSDSWLVDLIRTSTILRTKTIPNTYALVTNYFPPLSPESLQAATELATKAGEENRKSTLLNKLFVYDHGSDGGAHQAPAAAAKAKPKTIIGASGGTLLQRLTAGIEEGGGDENGTMGGVEANMKEIINLECSIVTSYVRQQAHTLRMAIKSGYALLLRREETPHAWRSLSEDPDAPLTLPTHLVRVLMTLGHEKTHLNRVLGNFTVENGQIDVPQSSVASLLLTQQQQQQQTTAASSLLRSRGERYSEYIFKEICKELLAIYADLIAKISSRTHSVTVSKTLRESKTSFAKAALHQCVTPHCQGLALEELEYIQNIIRPLLKAGTVAAPSKEAPEGAGVMFLSADQIEKEASIFAMMIQR